jgi:hypothetical protein
MHSDTQTIYGKLARIERLLVIMLRKLDIMQALDASSPVTGDYHVQGNR